MRWIFRFFSWWPLGTLHALGGVLGWLVWLLSARYRAQFRAHVQQAGLSFDVARPAIAEAGRFVAELPKLWLRPPGQSCLGRVRLAGLEHAERAFAAGRGVIFFGPHCGSFELGPQALAELFAPRFGPVTAVYRPARQPWLARLERLARNTPQLTVLPANLRGIRLMHKALKANRAAALLTDQVPPEGLGVWVPFFDRPAYTMTLAARLALQSGAPLLPVSCERLPRGAGYSLKIWPPIEQSADVLTLVTQINLAIETLVLNQPGQYLWGYARYKAPRSQAPTAQGPHCAAAVKDAA